MAGTHNDPFEEFEFRPINEGLGFHRKKTASVQTEEVKATPLTFQSPLPRPNAPTETRRPSSFQVPSIEDDSIAKAQTAVNDILKNLNQKRQLDFVQETAKQKMELKKSKPQFFAAVLDGMLIAAAFLLSLIVMLSITKVDLFMNLSHPDTSQMIYMATAGLFLVVTFIYMVVNRAFTGFTPGEWAFDQVCGKPEQFISLSYIPRIIFRTLLVMVTGFLTLPILSYLFNQDLAGQMAGLSLYQKPHA